MINNKDTSCFQGSNSLMENSDILAEGKHKVLWKHMGAAPNPARHSRKISFRNEKCLPTKYPWQFQGTKYNIV